MGTTTLKPTQMAYERIEKDKYGTYTETVWYNLSRIKEKDGSYASTSQIASRKGTVSKPGRVMAHTLTGTIPVNAKITKVRVEWRWYVRNPSGGTTGVPTIPGAYVCLWKSGVGCKTSTVSTTTAAPTSAGTSYAEFTTGLPTRSELLSGGYGVYWNPKRNTSYNPGYLYLDSIHFLVTYTEPSYTVQVQGTGACDRDDEVTYTFTLSDANQCPHTQNVPVDLSFSSDFQVTGYTTTDGSFDPSSMVWSALPGSGGSATLTVTGKYTTAGVKEVRITETVTNRTSSIQTTVTDPSITVTCDDYIICPSGQTVTLQITATGPQGLNGRRVRITKPSWATFTAGSGSDGSISGDVWTISCSSSCTTARLYLQITPNESGRWHLSRVKDEETGELLTLVSMITGSAVKPALHSVPVDLDLSDEEWENGDYELVFYVARDEEKYEWSFTGSDYEYAVISGEKVLYSFRSLLSSTPVQVRVPIPPGTADLKVNLGAVTGVSKAVSLRISDPVLVPSGGEYQKGVVTRHDEATGRWEVVLDNFSVEGGFIFTPRIPELPSGVRKEITGFQVELDVSCEELVDGSWVGSRNAYFTPWICLGGGLCGGKDMRTPMDERITLGGSADKWNLHLESLGIGEMEASSLGWDVLEVGRVSDMRVKLAANSATMNNIRLRFSKPKVTVYYDEVSPKTPGFSVNGVHSGAFRAHLHPDSDIQNGPVRKVEFTNYPYSFTNYPEKARTDPLKLKLKFIVAGGSIRESERLLQDLQNLLANETDEYRLPIPKTLKFDWDDRLYDYILTETVKKKPLGSAYECECEVTVPSGAGRLPPRELPPRGTHRSLTPPKPVIEAYFTVAVENPVFAETRSGAKILLLTRIPAGTTLYIDSARRMITDAEGVHYEGLVSWDSSWFLLPREYEITAPSGVVIRGVRVEEVV